MGLLLKKPLGYGPIVLSGGALAMMVGYVAVFGVDKGGQDEGLAARLYQLILLAQAAMVAGFGVKYLAKQTKEAALVMAIQVVAVLVPVVVIVLLEM